MSKPVTRISKAIDGARILWKRWTEANSDAREGYVREFSPSGGQLRISETPASDDLGEWYETANVRCVEVLQEEFDFAAVKATEEREKRRRPREDGEEWKDGAG